ncbi:glycosyltransferase [Eisenbergiella sp.]
MRIWIIGRDYPTVSNNGWGSFEFEQAKLLAKYNHEVSYISLTLSFFKRGDQRGFRYFEEAGVNIYTYSRLYFPGKAGIYLEEYEDNCWKNLLKKVSSSSGTPDVIHVHYPTMISSISLIEKYRNMGVKIFVTEHWSRVLKNTLKKHELKRMIYYASHANCFFTVGSSLQTAVHRIVDVTVPMDVIPNMVSPLFSLNISVNKNDKEFEFIMVGKLTASKQFDVVIRQFSEQFGGNKNVKLKIVGSGEDKNKLMKIAGKSEQIIFTGTLGLQDVAKEIAEADALISFSKYETFGVPIIEAWACGKPVIASTGTGVASYVNKDLGLIVAHDKTDQLRTAMDYIYKNIYTYNSQIISEFAMKNFSGETIYRKLFYSYEKY